MTAFLAFQDCLVPDVTNDVLGIFWISPHPLDGSIDLGSQITVGPRGRLGQQLIIARLDAGETAVEGGNVLVFRVLAS